MLFKFRKSRTARRSSTAGSRAVTARAESQPSMSDQREARGRQGAPVTLTARPSVVPADQTKRMTVAQGVELTTTEDGSENGLENDKRGISAPVDPTQTMDEDGTDSPMEVQKDEPPVNKKGTKTSLMNGDRGVPGRNKNKRQHPYRRPHERTANNTSQSSSQRLQGGFERLFQFLGRQGQE